MSDVDIGEVGGLHVSANPKGAVLGVDYNYYQLTRNQIRELLMLLERAYWYRWQDAEAYRAGGCVADKIDDILSGGES